MSAFGGKADIDWTTPGCELILADDRFARMAMMIPYEKREASMRYKPKSVAALHIALGGLPDNMRVTALRAT